MSDVTTKKLQRLRMRISKAENRLESLSYQHDEARRKLRAARVAYLEEAGWEVILADYRSYICRLKSGSGWCGMHEAEKRQRKRERAASRRLRKKAATEEDRSLVQ